MTKCLCFQTCKATRLCQFCISEILSYLVEASSGTQTVVQVRAAIMIVGAHSNFAKA